uniref:CASP-like protein n=1 Tax=Oryza meridionalis TaxID=40149 RepID=A0A0E0F0P3_9ORYZ
MWWFNRKGPSGFSGASTAEEVTAGIDARGLVAVITVFVSCIIFSLAIQAFLRDSTSKPNITHPQLLKQLNLHR